MSWQIITGDAQEVLADAIIDGKFQTCVTSPPYWGLRDYGHSGQLGQEETPEEYVENLVAVFRRVWRVLSDDGILWLNLGDTYAGQAGGWQGKNGDRASGTFTARIKKQKRGKGLKTKDLVGIPWRVALALQADGWYLRSDIIWSKPNPMPESVQDRPTRAHEYVFMLTKSPQYYYDRDAISEAASRGGYNLLLGSTGCRSPQRNARTVWQITPEAYGIGHFAVMPLQLAERCILAGSRPGRPTICRYSQRTTQPSKMEAMGHERNSIEKR